MSSTTPQVQPEKPPVPPPPKEIRIYGHTALFYWWPVWVIGYLLAAITYFHDSRVFIFPSEKLTVEERKENRIIEAKTIPKDTDVKERMHDNKNLGVVFCMVLFVVVLITNVPLRGLSSAIAIVMILLVTVFFAWMDWWDKIFHFFGRLSIHANLGFYMFTSTVLLIAWLLVFFVYDRLSYWRITPGQITHDFVFGGGQKSYDTEGMAFEKLRDDLFRHWVLGFGSGDMIMYPLTKTGASTEELQIHNVLFVGTKLSRIQALISKPGD